MLLAAILLAAPVCAAHTGYTDVPENAWYEEAIRTVTGLDERNRFWEV